MKSLFSFLAIASIIFSFALTAQAEKLPVPKELLNGSYKMRGVSLEVTEKRKCLQGRWVTLNSERTKSELVVDYKVSRSPNLMFVYGGIKNFEDVLHIEKHDGCEFLVGRYGFDQNPTLRAGSRLPLQGAFPATCTQTDGKVVGPLAWQLKSVQEVPSCKQGALTTTYSKWFHYGYRLNPQNDLVWSPEPIVFQSN